METSNPASGFHRTRPAIIPVIDIMGGRVVRAVGGRRESYAPINSWLTRSTSPGGVAEAIRAVTGEESVYVADLDAIVHGKPDIASVRAVKAAGLKVWCDAGFSSREQLDDYEEIADEIVIGTETANLAAIRSLVRHDRLAEMTLSVDLFEGRLIGDWLSWGVTGSDAVVDLVRVAEGLGFETVILLDLARVGSGNGPGTERLVKATKRACPDMSVLAGGGVRTWDDVQRVTDAGASAALVASALHDGTLTLPRPAP